MNWMVTREIWLADLDPSEGFEQGGKRPVLVISGNAMNSRSELAIICPLTTKVKNFAGNVVILPDKINGLTSPSEILTFQVRTVSAKRMIKRIGVVPKDVHNEILKNFIKICTY